jgi:hypothetical protein
MLSNASFHDADDKILVPDGLRLFSKALSAADVDSRLERTQAALRGLGVVDSLKLIDQSPSGFPSDAVTERKKRELAVWNFDTALRGGDLARPPRSCFRTTAWAQPHRRGVAEVMPRHCHSDSVDVEIAAVSVGGIGTAR